MTDRALTDLERIAFRDAILEETAQVIAAMPVTGSDKSGVMGFILVRDACVARIRSLKSIQGDH